MKQSGEKESKDYKTAIMVSAILAAICGSWATNALMSGEVFMGALFIGLIILNFEAFLLFLVTLK